MIALPLILCTAALLQQGTPENADAAKAPVRTKSNAWIVTGVTVGTRLPFAALQLGDGGVSPDPGPPGAPGPGAFRTRGGVLVRAKVEGVKFDFPSGGELLIDSHARVFERGGRATPPDSNGVQIWLADGAVVQVYAESGGGRELRWVQVCDGDQSRVLWTAGRPMSRNARSRSFFGRTYVALGDGRVLYEITQLGPLIVALRGLCPESIEKEYPERALIVAGDVLGQSLIELPAVAMQRAASEPRVQTKARVLAGLAPQMFEPGSIKFRPPGAVGRLEIPLGNGMHLDVDVREGGDTVLALKGAGDDTSLCEWHVLSNTTLLHLVERRKPDEDPYFAMQGYDLRHLVLPLLPLDPSPTRLGRARHVLVELGG